MVAYIKSLLMSWCEPLFILKNRKHVCLYLSIIYLCAHQSTKPKIRIEALCTQHISDYSINQTLSLSTLYSKPREEREREWENGESSNKSEQLKSWELVDF